MTKTLEQEPFSYKSLKDDEVQIYSNGKLVTRLRGKAGIKFLTKVAGLNTFEQQRLMARVTGQFKFGNERLAKVR